MSISFFSTNFAKAAPCEELFKLIEKNSPRAYDNETIEGETRKIFALGDRSKFPEIIEIERKILEASGKKIPLDLELVSTTPDGKLREISQDWTPTFFGIRDKAGEYLLTYRFYFDRKEDESVLIFASSVTVNKASPRFKQSALEGKGMYSLIISTIIRANPDIAFGKAILTDRNFDSLWSELKKSGNLDAAIRKTAEFKTWQKFGFEINPVTLTREVPTSKSESFVLELMRPSFYRHSIVADANLDLEKLKHYYSSPLSKKGLDYLLAQMSRQEKYSGNLEEAILQTSQGRNLLKKLEPFFRENAATLAGCLK